MVYRAVRGPVDQANEFLAAVDAGDFDAAGAMASTDSRCLGETARADIEAFFAGVDITGYNLKSVNVSSGNGESIGDVTGTITIDGRPTTGISMSLLKRGDSWQICGIEIE